eukprot:11399994-Prorocentrum_lima.AAC.1
MSEPRTPAESKTSAGVAYRLAPPSAGAKGEGTCCGMVEDNVCPRAGAAPPESKTSGEGGSSGGG